LFTVTPGVAQLVNYELVVVGNLGNANDTTGYGGVNYEYQIGKYEVTIGQYTAFLNAVGRSDPYGLYNADMAYYPSTNGISRGGVSGGYTYTAIGPDGLRPFGATSVGNRPISWVNWFDAARFANWLSNGCPVGPCDSTTTEDGVYSLGGVKDGGTISSRNSINPNTGFAPAYFVPTENEWYKAAYFDPKLNGGTGGYWRYPTRSNDAPGNIAGSSPNQANYRFEDSIYSVTGRTTRAANQNYLTDVGAFSGSPSAYGTFDQGGNVREWTTGAGIPSTSAVMRGGNFVFGESSLASSYREVITQNPGQFYGRGFRLASPGPTFRTISVISGTQTQSQVGYATLSGSLPVVKIGAGALVLNAANTFTGTTSIQQGSIKVAHAAALSMSTVSPRLGGTLSLSPSLQTTIAGLNPNAGGLVDVGTGMVTVANGLTPTALVTALQSGRAGGSWTGPSGITSSAAASSNGTRTVGWLDNGNGSVTFSYAAPGDTNLDWTVDILDAGNFLTRGKFDTGLPATWIEGDFNYDATVDILDAADFFATSLYDAGSYNSPAGSIAAVPEPSTLGLLGVVAGIAGLMAMRRKRAI
jgi:autotransporter-associated beta strand protein